MDEEVHAEPGIAPRRPTVLVLCKRSSRYRYASILAPAWRVVHVSNLAEAQIQEENMSIDLILVEAPFQDARLLTKKWVANTNVLFLGEEQSLAKLQSIIHWSRSASESSHKHLRDQPKSVEGAMTFAPSVKESSVVESSMGRIPADHDHTSREHSSRQNPWVQVTQWFKRFQPAAGDSAIGAPQKQQSLQKQQTQHRSRRLPTAPAPSRIVPPVPGAIGVKEQLDQRQAHVQHIISNPTALREPILNGFLLGPFQIALHDVVIRNWPSRKGRSLLAYLLYNHKRLSLKEVLMEKFWPEVAPESARNSLNVALHGIRRMLRRLDNTQEYILFRNESYQINPDLPVQLDHEDFLRFWQRAQHIDRTQSLDKAVRGYENAIRIYRGEFLEDDLYDDWSTNPRAKMREAYIFALDRLSLHYLSTRQFDSAIRLCKNIIEKDGCREDIHRRLMKCYYHDGHREKAIKQFYSCEDLLQTELDVAPGHATLDLLSQIKSDTFV